MSSLLHVICVVLKFINESILFLRLYISCYFVGTRTIFLFDQNYLDDLFKGKKVSPLRY